MRHTNRLTRLFEPLTGPNRPAFLAFAVLLIAQVIYLWTLAPSVLWGDDAKLQTQAFELDLRMTSAADHPLWVLLAHPFTLLPIGDPAFRTNLFTSICAASSVAFAYAGMRRLTGSSWAATVGATALMVSHNFWTHAVRTEVYSLNFLLLSASIYLLAGSPKNRWRLWAAWFLLGCGVVQHVMVWLVIPGLIYYCWRIHRHSTWQARDLGVAALMFAAPNVAYEMIVDAPSTVALDPLAYIPTLHTLMREGPRLVLFLGLQYPSPALLLAIGRLLQPKAGSNGVCSTDYLPV